MNFSFITSFLENRKSRNQLLVIVSIAVAGFFVLFSDYGLIKRISLMNTNRNLVNSIEESQRRADSLKSDIELLRYDTLTIERIAREKYGLIKSGETVIIINSDDK